MFRVSFKPRAFKIAAATLAVIALGGGLLTRYMVMSEASRRTRVGLDLAFGGEMKAESITAENSIFPAVILKDVRAGNPAGCPPDSGLQVSRIRVKWSFLSLLAGRPRVVAVELGDPVLLIRENSAGITNFAALVDRLTGDRRGEAEAGAAAAASFDHLESLVITGGRILGEGKRPGSWRDIFLRLKRPGRGKPWAVEARVGLLGNAQHGLSFEGAAGPFTRQAAPIKGKASATMHPRLLPADFLLKKFGVLAAPSEWARIRAELDLEGDLRTTAAGNLRFGLEQFQVGRNVKLGLPITGEGTGQSTFVRALTSPEVRFAVTHAELGFGGGRLRLKLDVAGSPGGALLGKVSGSLAGLRIEEFLGAFFETPPPVHGAMTVPRFNFDFGGKDAAELLDSLSGGGRVEINDGRLTRMDLVGSITASLGKGGSALGTTEFSTLGGDFTISNRTVNVSDVNLVGPSGTVTGQGRINRDGSLSLNVNAKVRGGIAELLGARAGDGRFSEAAVSVQITGTADKPVLRPALRRKSGA